MSRETAYAIRKLESVLELVRAVQPATDRPEDTVWMTRALETAIARLKEPHFEINPFI